MKARIKETGKVVEIILGSITDNYFVTKDDNGDEAIVSKDEIECVETRQRPNRRTEKRKEMNELKSKYDELVSSIGNARMYDGRGKYNGYVCKNCGYITVTLYKDKGVTPFTIRCEKCENIATHEITSRFHPPAAPNISKVKNWVRPTFEQLVKMGEADIKHVLNGGLVLEDKLKEK